MEIQPKVQLSQPFRPVLLLGLGLCLGLGINKVRLRVTVRVRFRARVRVRVRVNDGATVRNRVTGYELRDRVRVN